MILNQELMQTLFNYNEETGFLTWKKSTGPRGIIGNPVGTINYHGYYSVGLFGKKYKVHRLIWLYVYGYIPENDLDHINGFKLDNRISNLREVSNQCNIRNSKKYKNNNSNITGISFDKKLCRWTSWITINKKNYFLGRYLDYDEAVCHRFAVEQCLDWNSCNLNSSAYKYVKVNIQKY